MYFHMYLVAHVVRTVMSLRIYGRFTIDVQVYDWSVDLLR